MHYRFFVLFIGLLLAQSSAADSIYYETEVFGLAGQGQMEAFDINNQNDVVGRVDIVDPDSGSIKPTGFLRDAGGAVTLIDVPGSGQLNGTQARGINDAGQIVGSFVTEDGLVASHGFKLDSGIITQLDEPTAKDTQANDINNAGAVVGRVFIQPQTGLGSGSAFTLEDGEYSLFRSTEARGSFGIAFNGSNDQGNVVGRVFDDTGFRAFAIIDGIYMAFTIPGDTSGGTSAWGINNQNQIVGTFRTGIENHGFLMDETGIYQIDVPGAGSFGSFILGLNNTGTLVGSISNSGFPLRQPVVVSPCSAASATCFEAPRISDAVIEFPPRVIDVDIDIKPGNIRNKINLRKKWKLIPVAVLGSIDFDATQIDYTTVRFGTAGASPAHQGHVRDVNRDGFPDMKFHFKTKNTGIECGDTEATLTGETFGGVQITGTDMVKTIRCN